MPEKGPYRKELANILDTFSERVSGINPDGFNNPRVDLSIDAARASRQGKLFGKEGETQSTPFSFTPQGQELARSMFPVSDVTSDELGSRLEANLQAMREARDAAVRRSGSAAASQYNQAIARTQAEIDRLQQLRGAYGEIADTQSQRTGAVYDAQAASAGIGLAQANEFAAENTATIKERLVGTTARVDRATVDSMSRMGTDPAIQEQVLTRLTEIEDVFMDAMEANAESYQRVREAQAEVARTAAIKSGAVSEFEIRTNQQIMDLQMQDRINQLIEEKQRLAASRASAVSSARSATAKEFEGLFVPFGEQGYTDAGLSIYLRDVAVENGVPISRMNDWYAMIVDTASFGGGGRGEVRNLIYGFTTDEFGNQIPNLPNVSDRERDITFEAVWNGVKIYQDLQQDYLGLIGQDPESFAPYSLARSNVIYNNLLDSQVYTPAMAAEEAKNPIYHENYNPTPTSSATSGGSGFRVR